MTITKVRSNYKTEKLYNFNNTNNKTKNINLINYLKIKCISISFNIKLLILQIY